MNILGRDLRKKEKRLKTLYPRLCRFAQQYNTVRAIEVNINSVINLLRTHLRNDSFEGANELRTTVAQWVVAQVYLGFGWLPSYRQNQVDEWSWEKVNEYGLISEEDRLHLMSLPVGEYPITEVRRMAGSDLLLGTFSWSCGGMCLR